MTLKLAAFFASERLHNRDPDYVFPDGVVLKNVVDAIAAAGMASNYVLANQLKIQYAIDVCTRCAQWNSGQYDKQATLQQFGIDAWGSICAHCTLEFLAAGRVKRSAT